MSLSLKRLAAAVLALASAVSSSSLAETRRLDRTTAERIAADLARVLGPGSVQIEEGSRPRPAPAPSRHPSAEGPPRGSAAVASAEQTTILEAMNRERASRGLRPLRLNRQLSLAANDRVRDMFEQGYFDHVAPDGTEPFVWMKRRGYNYRTAAENLAVGYRGLRVVNGWMNSPGHRANILDGNHDEVGLAIGNGAPIRGYTGPTVVALYASAR